MFNQSLIILYSGTVRLIMSSPPLANCLNRYLSLHLKTNHTEINPCISYDIEDSHI
jgi:putative heme degradation protein